MAGRSLSGSSTALISPTIGRRSASSSPGRGGLCLSSLGPGTILHFTMPPAIAPLPRWTLAMAWLSRWTLAMGWLSRWTLALAWLSRWTLAGREPAVAAPRDRGHQGHPSPPPPVPARGPHPGVRGGQAHPRGQERVVGRAVLHRRSGRRAGPARVDPHGSDGPG